MVTPLRIFGDFLYGIDRIVIDGIVALFGWVPQLTGFAIKLTVQRGYLQGYATTMLFGIMVILVVIFLSWRGPVG